MVGLRESSIRQFLKKNFDFILGILSEIGLVLIILAVSVIISFLLVFLKP